MIDATVEMITSEPSGEETKQTYSADQVYGQIEVLKRIADEITTKRDEITALKQRTKEMKELLGAMIMAVDIPMHKLRDFIFELYWVYDDVVPAVSVKCLAEDRLGIKGLSSIVRGRATLVCGECGAEVQEIVSSRSNLQGVDRHYRCEACKQKEREARETALHYHAEIRQQQIAELRALQYQEYLKTGHWQEIRKRALARAGHCCQLCNSTGKLHVHHRTYENLGQERNSDLIVLCPSCHEKFHIRDIP